MNYLKVLQLVLILCAPASMATAADRPNIVLILVDDMPWYGTDVRMDPDLPGSAMAFRRMPNVQRLAEQGMTFQHAYSGAGMCAPSRCCLQTGMTAAHHLYSGNGGFGPKTDGTVEYTTKKADARRPLLCPEPQGNIRFPSIGDVLRAGGYTTGHFGKWHLYGGGPAKHGYDQSDGETDNKTFRPATDPKTGKKVSTCDDPKLMFSITDRSIKFMESAVKAHKPFYLQISHYATHAQYQSRPETLAKVEKDPVFQKAKDLPSRELQTAQLCAAMCEDLDTAIGLVLKKMDELGIANNTYVVFTSDNGYKAWNEGYEPLRGGKWWLWEGGIRVPMIVRGPSVPAGSRSSVNVVNYDLLPTFADLAGATSHLPKEVDGTSFKALLFGQPVSDSYIDRPLFFHYPHYRVSPPASAIIAGQGKLLHYYERPEKEFLYNLKDDLGEKSNLATAQPEKAAQMVKQLISQIKAVGGYFPKPNPNADPNAQKYDPSNLSDQAADAPKVNLLFIMTDQQRWDAMSCAGNPVIKTPHFDRLAREGVRFTNFYSACPVCTPARTAILTGHSIQSNHVLSNGDAKRTDVPPFPSFDQILLRNGYRGEYHGKYHSPYQLALDYTQPVRWLNGKKAPPGCKAESSEAEAYMTFVEEKAPHDPVRPGQLATRKGNYTPIPLDAHYGGKPEGKSSQADMYGRLEMPAEFSRAAFTAKEGLAALERLKDGPFTLTISFDPPHPPMVVSDPYYGQYPPDRIPVPGSINDPRSNSPYRTNKRGEMDAYRDPTNIQQMRSIYYGMVTEVDAWVGRILQRLDELGLANNTLVIFTSDHGEMLGDHGMHGKGVFYEGSAHVPLLMRLPGVIPANTVVQTPASQVDLFATILDYCGQTSHASEGQSLRPFIEAKEDGAERAVVSQWNSRTVPGFMVCDGRWKLLFGQTDDAPSLDALYDLKTDPQEMNNLIGQNPDREKYRIEATRMKGLLVEWLSHVKSPSLETVKARPIFSEAQTAGE